MRSVLKSAHGADPEARSPPDPGTGDDAAIAAGDQAAAIVEFGARDLHRGRAGGKSATRARRPGGRIRRRRRPRPRKSPRTAKSGTRRPAARATASSISPAIRKRGARARGPANGGDLPGLDQTLVRPETLRDHLLAQLSVELHEPADRLIGAHLIELVDEFGLSHERARGRRAHPQLRALAHRADAEAPATLRPARRFRAQSRRVPLDPAHRAQPL